MFDQAFAFFTGVVVTQEKNEVILKGFKTRQFVAAMENHWGTSRITNNMFSKLRDHRMELNAFFLPDLVYIMKTLAGSRKARINKSMVKETLDLIEDNTWMKSVYDPSFKSRLDMSALERFKWKPLVDQTRFLETYNETVPRYNLKGYLLGAAPGSGKTLANLFLSECLNTDITICIVPKNSVERVWVDTLESAYHITPSYWYSTSGNDLPQKPVRYYVAHYEQLEKLVKYFKSHCADKRINIVLDESHNFNEVKSQRTDLFVELCKITRSNDIVWASGTPVKAMGAEVIPMMRTLDPYFTPDVEERFKKIYGLSSARGLDIIANRLGYMMFKVDKASIVTNKLNTFVVKVQMDGSDEFTLSSIRKQMGDFIKERMKYYEDNMKMFHNQYFEALEWYEGTLSRSDLAEYKEYLRCAKLLHTSYNPEVHKAEPILCNNYEKRKIIPALPKTMREEFKNARSVYKYYNLKVQGEALGRILGRQRTKCNVSMLHAWKEYTAREQLVGKEGPEFKTNLIEIVDSSAKKSLVFTSYVEVVDEAAKIFTDAGAMPLKVYGDTNSNLASIIKTFFNDPKANPVIATLASLSTAVPITVANTVIFLNTPFRAHEYEQAVSRSHRIGQTEEVNVWNVYLDTGAEPNISTRSNDIMEWSREQVAILMGNKYIPQISAAVESFNTEFGLEEVAADLEVVPTTLDKNSFVW